MKKSGCIILLLFLAVCASLFVNMMLLSTVIRKGSSPSLAGMKVRDERDFEEVSVKDGTSSKKIVIIPMDGVIAHGAPGSLGDNMVEDFKRALEQAQEDPQVKAVIISVDSPGGEITASDVLYHALQEFTKHKPSIIYFNSLGASGAYYTACGSSYIMCNATTFTGSIGVIISTLNYKDLFGKVGLQSVVFKSGKFKDMLNGARDMSPEEQAYVQGLIMQSYGRFVGIVAKARKLDEAELRSGIADGRILTGTDALEAHLVDQLGYIEDAYAKAKDLGKSPDAEIVRYKRSITFSSFLRLFAESKAPSIKLDLMENMTQLKPGQVYLLPSFFAP